MIGASGGARSHPTWEEMRSLLESGPPTIHLIDGTPTVSILLDPTARVMGFRAPLQDLGFTPGAPLAEIQPEKKTVDGVATLDLVVRNPSLFPYFFSFVLSLADMIQVDKIPVAQAVDRALDQWRSLFRRVAMLSDEEQTGLAGELWMLERLASVWPNFALQAWIGPAGEAHDFRIANQEFEVKATRSERRIHVITSLGQLVPSPGHELFVLSLQFAAGGAGGGESLFDKVVRLQNQFDAVGLGPTFEALLLGRYGINPITLEYYRERIQLRSEPRLVPVSVDFPCIRPEDIQGIGKPGMERVLDVRYRLDLTGLGFSDGSPEFLATIPATLANK
jgi:hypothetical protein